MKKNLFIVFAVIAFAALFTACPNPNSGIIENEKPEVVKVAFIDNNSVELSYIEGDINLDADKLAAIDFIFNKDMDQSYMQGWVYWWNIWDDIYRIQWIGSRRIRFYINFRYNQEYQISLNNKAYIENQDPTFVKYFYRDVDGNLLKEKTVYFNTANKTRNSKTFELSLDDFNSLTFSENAYNKSLNIGYINLNSLLGKEKLQEGDIVKVKYNLWSYNDLPEIKGQLADTSNRANGWTLLASEQNTYIKSLKATPKPKEGEDVVPNYCSGEVTYHVTTNQIDPGLVIQLYYEKVEGTDPITLLFKSTYLGY